MANPLRLYDLFPGLQTDWPFHLIPGMDGGDPPITWLDDINAAAQLSDLRTNTTADGTAFSCKFQIASPVSNEFRIHTMPDILFKILNTGTSDAARFGYLFVNTGPAGAEIIIERLPVEIQIPPDIIFGDPKTHKPGEDDGDDINNLATEILNEVQDHFYTDPDAQYVVLRNDFSDESGVTSVYTRIRLHITTNLDIAMSTAAPISFGKCGLFNLPVLAIHDFQLIPSLNLIYDENRKLTDTGNWVRHGSFITEAPVSGFAMRSVEFNTESGYFKKHFPGKTKRNEKAEWVLEDLIFHFNQGIFPYHFTVGVRRNIENFNDDTDITAFQNAAYSIPVKDLLSIHIYQLLVQTPFSSLNNYRFKVGFTFGKDEPPASPETSDTRFEPTIELVEDATFRLGLTFHPVGPNNALSWRNWKVSDDLFIQPVGLKVGFSLDKYQAHESFADCVEGLASFWIHDSKAKWNPDGTGTVSPEPLPAQGDNVLKLPVPVTKKGPADKPLSFMIVNVGWSKGSVALEKFAFPEGYVVSLGSVPIELFELGLITEDDANYFSISGGLLIPGAKTFEGGVWFKRMRFRVGGNSSAPPFKLDGIIARLSKKGMWLLEAGGFVTDEDVVSENYHKSEFAFTGVLQFFTGCKFVIALDLIAGKITALDDPNNSFKYFMFQLLIGGKITLGSIELVSIRGLLAQNMAPNLAAGDLAQGEMRYYKWSRTIDPFTVPGNRRLAAWKPREDALTLGIGMSVSFVGLGDLVRISAFVLYINSPADQEKGLMIAVEVFYGKPNNQHDNQSKRPLGWGVLEYDLLTDHWRLQLGIDLTLKTFVENAPQDLADIFKVKGTLFIARHPRWEIAIGRIDDQNTWAMFTWNWDLWDIARTYVMIAFCFEYVEGTVKAIGLVVRMEGGIDAGFFGISYYAGILIAWKSMTSGTSEYVFLAQAEIGGSIKLFWVIRFGLDVKAEVRQVGYGPTQTGLEIRIHVSTSWWLPDINWTYEKISGDPAPSERQLVTSPVASASSLHAPTSTGTVLYTESLAKGLISLDQVDGLFLAEAPRLQRFAAAIAATENPLQPIATDASIIVKFSVPVEQSLGIGPVDGDWGTQVAGDDESFLKVRTKLTGISVRRRPRFGANRIWSALENFQQMQIIDPATGDPIEGEISFAQTNLSYLWEADAQENGRIAPINLMINSDTPYTYTTQNVQGDENILTQNPEWPCCSKNSPRLHWYYFRNEPLGELNKNRRRLFFVANGLEYITTDGFIVNKVVTANAAPVAVAAFNIDKGKQIMRMVFDEDAFAAGIYVSADFKRSASLTLIAEDLNGEEVLVKKHTITREPLWQYVVISGKSFRSVRVLADQPAFPWTLFVDMATWIATRDYAWSIINTKSCADLNPNRQTDYSGNGGLFFLPNHEYEICLTSEISVMHSTTQWETREGKEYVYFITKGLPGLNYTKNVGEEITPYVQSRYPFRRPFIYAEEPVVLSMNEKFKLSLPIAFRRPGTQEEHLQMMNLRLFVNKDIGDKLTPGPATAVDWITSAAQSRPLVIKGDFRRNTILGKSTDEKRKRLATVRAASTFVGCSSVNILNAHQTTLIVFPTDRTIEDKKYWTPDVTCTARLRLDSDIFIDHPAFEPGDINAFNFTPNASGWSIVEGKLVASGTNNLHFARFGNADWNYFTLKTEITGIEGEAGFVVARDTLTGNQLVILVSSQQDSNTLRIYSGNPGTVVGELQLPASGKIQLSVTAYDDQVWVNANGESIAAPRVNARHGYCGFAVNGSATFSNLFAEPIVMYEFDFSISRFNGFKEHIADFQSGLLKLQMNAEADFNTERNKVAALLPVAMAPASTDTERESLFVKLVAAGGLFIGQNVKRSAITSLQTAGEDCSCLLIESTESLDFSTGELLMTLSRKFTGEQTGPLEGIGSLLDLLTIVKTNINNAGSGPGLDPNLHVINEILFRDNIVNAGMLPTDRFVNFQEKWTYSRLIASIQVSKGINKNTINIKTEYNNRGLVSPLAGKDVYYIEYVRTPGQLKIYKCLVESRTKMRGALMSSIDLAWDKRWGLAGIQSIRLIIVSSENLVCFGELTSQTNEWRTAPVASIQNHNATQVLVMPAAVGSFFEKGDWKLTFVLNRTRYATLDTADTTANYNGEETINFTI